MKEKPSEIFKNKYPRYFIHKNRENEQITFSYAWVNKEGGAIYGKMKTSDIIKETDYDESQAEHWIKEDKWIEITVAELALLA